MFAPRLLAVGLALLVDACAPLLVNSYLETGADMTRYRTYRWASHEGEATGDPRLDNNPFFDATTRAAVDRALAGKGLEATAGAADLVLRFHISIKQQLDLGGTDSPYLGCDGCSPTVYEAGTLVVDAVEARTNRLLWRAWAEGSFDRVIDDQAALERRIEEAVARIMARYPVTRALEKEGHYDSRTRSHR
ncbi:MAG TPA: DUF4136 domain-containing protein [Solirubrobacteraceae bacterium]